MADSRKRKYVPEDTELASRNQAEFEKKMLELHDAKLAVLRMESEILNQFGDETKKDKFNRLSEAVKNWPPSDDEGPPPDRVADPSTNGPLTAAALGNREGGDPEIVDDSLVAQMGSSDGGDERSEDGETQIML
jgi:hypothetical protein